MDAAHHHRVDPVEILDRPGDLDSAMTAQNLAQCRARLQPRERSAEAEVDAVAEPEVGAGGAGEVEAVGVATGVAVGAAAGVGSA